MRLIDADEIVKFYQRFVDKHGFNPNDVRFSINDIELNLLNIPTADRWIPCSERLPKEDGRYLCTFQGVSVATCWFERGHFRIYGEIKDKLISAWMPLPKPYEEDNE